MTLRLGRIAVAFITFLTVVALSAGVAAAASQLGSLTQIHSANDDMDSTAVEWSGATHNADSNVLLTVDDEDKAFEFQLKADGTIDSASTPRIIDLAFGRTDFEGVAWIDGETYAFLSEGSGEVIIATVPAAANGQTRVTNSDVEDTFSAAPTGFTTNLGPEGIATDGDAFYITKEMPATLTKVELDGTFIASVDLFELADATGVAALADGTFLVISHESRVVAHYDINWNTEVATQLASRDAAGFTQLEGIAVDGTSDVHLFGEDNTRKGNPGQTYSHLQGALLPPQYQTADIDCSGSVDITDALIINRQQVGLTVNVAGCGSGDHNGDGQVDLIDALLIAQCSVGIPNVGCPG